MRTVEAGAPRSYRWPTLQQQMFPMMTFTDVSNAALLELHRDSINRREESFRPGFRPWARDLCIERHDAIVREMIRRGLLAASPNRARHCDCAQRVAGCS